MCTGSCMEVRVVFSSHESVLSFLSVGLGDQIQVVRPGSKRCCPLSLCEGPEATNFTTAPSVFTMTPRKPSGNLIVTSRTSLPGRRCVFLHTCNVSPRQQTSPTAGIILSKLCLEFSWLFRAAGQVFTEKSGGKISSGIRLIIADLPFAS